MAEHNQFGHEGEQIACDYLLSKGYKILERNYRHQRKEVDIIATFDNELIAVEVKSRSSTYFGNPEDFIKSRQMQKIVKAVDAYVQIKNLEMEVRFDVISIAKMNGKLQINHIENAFYGF